LPGEDLYLSESKFEFGRNFMNKVWNASRFILMNIDEKSIKDYSIDDLIEQLNAQEGYLAEKWIISELISAINDIDKALDGYRFHEASSRVYDFFWHKLCDWYIELAKLHSDDELTQNTLYLVLKNVLKMLHPFVPYITEEIWQKLPKKDNEFIMLSAWPKAVSIKYDKKQLNAFESMMGLVSLIRNKRAQFNISPKINITEVKIVANDKETAANLAMLNEYFKGLGKIETLAIEVEDIEPYKSGSVVVYKSLKAYINLEGLIDVEKEKARLDKEIRGITKEIESIKKRLVNKAFLNKAPENVVAQQKKRLDEYKLKLGELKAALKEIN
jgi:valyl-tRNA synthetase